MRCDWINNFLRPADKIETLASSHENREKPKSIRLECGGEKKWGAYIEDESLVGGFPGETAEEVDAPDQHQNRRRHRQDMRREAKRQRLCSDGHLSVFRKEGEGEQIKRAWNRVSNMFWIYIFEILNPACHSLCHLGRWSYQAKSIRPGQVAINDRRSFLIHDSSYFAALPLPLIYTVLL